MDKNGKECSIHRSKDFYENQPVTWPWVEKLGGVCGEVSKTCVGACQARGVPAMPVGQPGHCALIWAKPNNKGSWDWTLYNDVGGITNAYRHGRIQTPWLGAAWMEKNWIWSVFAYNHCLTNIDGHIQSVLDNFDPQDSMLLTVKINKQKNKIKNEQNKTKT